MADLHLQFSGDEVAALANKIRELDGLDDRERALLLAIFAAAAGGVDRSGKRGPTVALAGILVQEQQPGGEAPESGAGEQTELGDLLDQLLHAYTPENDFGSLYGTKIFYKISPGQGGGS